LRVTNTGNITDTFDVLVAGNAWTTIAASQVGPLAAGVGAPLSVSVSVPVTALAGAKDTADITLTSQGNPSQSSTSVLTTTANTVYGVVLEPSAKTRSGDPDTQVAFTLRVTNTGNITDTFDVSVAGNAWTTLVVSQVGPLAPNSGADLGVIVSIPVTTPSGTIDVVQVTLTSQADFSKSFTSLLTTGCNIVRGLALKPPAMAQFAHPGAQVTCTLRVTNTGNITDTFDVLVAGNAWTTIAASRVGPLAAGVGAPLSVSVSVPVTALAGAKDTADITLTSQGNPSRSSTSVLTTTANTVYGVVLEPSAKTRSGDPDTQVAFTLRVTNTGNITDTFDVLVAGNAWTTIAATRVGPLAAGVGVPLSVSVSVPVTALAGAKDTADITLTSQGNPSQSSTSVLTTTVNTVHGLALEPSVMTQSSQPGTNVTYTLRFTNTGNMTETFTLDYTGNTWNVQLLPAISVTLTSGAGSNFIVRVTIPPTATGKRSDTVLVKVMGAGVSRASTLTTQVIFQIYLPLVTNYSVQSESRLQLKARLQRR
jgi:predicted secreted protein